MLRYKNSFFFFIHFFAVSIAICQTSIEKDNTYIADSLDVLGAFNEALNYRSLALEEPNHSSDYIKFLNAKWHYSKSCSYELLGGLENHKKALLHSIKGREFADEMTNSSSYLKLHLANRIYHQYGYLQNWKLALNEALINLKILQDSIPDNSASTLLVLDDIGFIYNKLGDHINSLKYYEKVAKVYKKYHPDNKKDLAMNYSVMATNYRKLGMLKKEFEFIVENEKLSKENKSELNSPLFKCYGKYSQWYTYYGNYDLAETYLNKQFQLIDSVKHKALELKSQRRAKYLDLYSNYIELYLQKGDFNKVKKYIKMSENELKESNRIFSEDIAHEATLNLYKSKLPEHSTETSIAYLNSSIHLINSYKAEFPFLNTTKYNIEIFNRYNDSGKLLEAENQMKKLLRQSTGENEHLQFYYYSNYADLLAKNQKIDSAKIYYDKAIDLFLYEKDSMTNISEVSINKLKPYYSFESIEGFLIAADFYFNQFKNHKNNSNLKIAQNLYFLTADIFSNLYLGERYNENLYVTFKKIENGLLKCLEYSNDSESIKRVIETIENSTSKLTWSKFLYSKERLTLNIPDSIVDKEHEIKTLINHYQNELFINKTDHKLESDTLKNRITSLNLDLKNLRKNIKSNYSNYYNRNFESFDLISFRTSLESDELVLKYVFSADDLYCILISKSNIEIKLINSSKKLKTLIETYIETLSTYNSNYLEISEELYSLIIPVLTTEKHKKIKIIPDGILNYLPFETLLFNSNILPNYTLSYATSLTLLNEQNNLHFNKQDLNIGVFASINKSNKELPSAQNETTSILKNFKGTLFNNVNKSTFLKEANAFNMIHIATHSYINNENPDLSRLQFHDTDLLISELYNESLNAQLVVLSACETGSGRIVNGEGVQSMARAFTYTGIPSSVVSLWKVDDEATSKIMTNFYKYLKKGKSKDLALRNAKLDYLNSTDEEALKHPYYWAGFILSGNTLPLATNNTNTYWYLGLMGFIIIILFRKKLYFFK